LEQAVGRRQSYQQLTFEIPSSKIAEQRRLMQNHSVAVAWWATIEVLFGRFDHNTGHLKDLHRLDWGRQEGIMAEALSTYDPDQTYLF
jgi:hypothetical protein